VRLDVGTIATQYEVGSSQGIQPFFTATSTSTLFGWFSAFLPFVTVTAAARPSLTYVPVNDPETVRRLFEPGSLESLVFLAQSSWPISTIFPLWVNYLNDVPNAVGANGPPRSVVSDSSRFRRVVELLQTLQDAGAIHLVGQQGFVPLGSPLPAAALTAQAQAEAAKSGLVYQRNSDGSWVLAKPSPKLFLKISPAVANNPEVQELRQLLRLEPNLTLYEVTVSSIVPINLEASSAKLTGTINVLPRSTIQALFYLSHGVVVPEDHLKEGIVTSEDISPTAGIFTVHSAGQLSPPSSAAVAVKYRGYWYYIDERDIGSRRTFSLMILMGQLSIAKPTQTGPVLTLPVGRG